MADIDARAELSSPVGQIASLALKSQNGLLHYWPMDEASGNIVDAINGLEGAGGASVPALVSNGRYVSDLDPAAIRVYNGPENLDYKLSQWSMSVAFLYDSVNEDPNSGFSPEIINYGYFESGKSTVYAYLQRGMPNRIFVELYNEAGDWVDGIQYDSPQTLSDAPHLLTLTCNGSITYVYLDGQQVSTISGAVNFYPQIYLVFGLGGGNYNLPNYEWISFNGWFDELAIWGRVLEAEEVSGLWAGGSGAPANTWPLASVFDVYGSLPSPVSQIRIRSIVDYDSVTGSSESYYLMEIAGLNPAKRIPISSWQATLQLSRSNYVQCVIPSAFQYLDEIAAQTEFVIYRAAKLQNGEIIESEMTRAPIQTTVFQQGPYNSTCTISGYSAGFLPAEVAQQTDRQLKGIQSTAIDAGGNMRVRAAIDWLLRPGMRAIVDGRTFVASYINYYVGSGQSYMDVGERAL